MTKKTKKKSPSGKKRKTTKKKKKTSFFGSAFKWLFVLGLWSGIFLVALLAWYAQELPDISKAPQFERKASIIVKAVDGSTIARYGEIVGNSVTVEDMPSHLIYAVIAVEDRRFYQHFGLDPLGITRAMVVNIKKGHFVQGGSTITQQLAKNLFLSRDRTLKRKIQEAMLAFWLEHELSKDEILSAYLNRVYLGSGVYGVDAAARLYFNKPVKDINLRESAVLAGLLKAPSRYSPLKNPTLSRQRSDVVLNAMADAGYLTEDEATGLTSVPHDPPDQKNKNAARYYTDWVVDGIDDLIGTTEEDLIVHTTLRPRIQKNVENALTRVLDKYGEERVVSQGAAIIMDPNGAVLAMIGGKNYGESQFNRITQAKRQPGSAFKPIVYLTALENGWYPDDLVIDEPITKGRYRPKNFAHKYMGEVELKTALTFSLNTVSVNLMKEIGVHPVIDTARRLGIYSPLEPDLSLALGSTAITPLELAVAYATLANGGRAVYPYAITRIADENGHVYYQRRQARQNRIVVERQHVSNITNMLESVVQYGTGRGAQQSFSVAGKTGTSQESRDGWFMGYTDKLVGGVWLGNDDNTPMKNVTGGSLPAMVWSEMIRSSYAQYRRPQSSYLSSSSGFEGLLERITPSAERRREYEERRRHENTYRYNN